MAQIADVMHASFALDAARQELSCRLLRTDMNRHVISSFMEEMASVLQEAVMRWRLDAMGEEAAWLIEEAERQSIRDWLMRLIDAAYGIRAMAEDRSSSSPTPEIGNKIKEKLEEVTEEYWSFEYERLPLASCMEHPCIVPCRGQETFDVFVGRGYDKQKIFDLLTQAEAKAEHPIILPIFGFAGVGKTMLVKHLFHDIRFRDYHKAWVDMSSMYYFNLNEIAASILSQVPGGELYKGDLGLHELQLCVGGKMKLLVVLDGLWETCPSRMNNLKQLLFGMNLIVIVTTASKAIADHMSSAVKPYQLHPLSDDMCLAIINRISGFEATHSKDNAVAEQSIGLEIATRCGGLPLAAQALGHILRSVNPQEWAVDMTWNFVGWNSPPPLLTISVLSHLMTVYQCLIQDTELRRCFALCAFFIPKGKGHSIAQHDLIHQFSVFHQYYHFKTAFKQNDHFKRNVVCDLLDGSFLLHEKSPSTIAEYAYAEESRRLTMNDLVHDFARYVLGDRMIVVDGGNEAMPSHVNNINAFCAIVSNLNDRAWSDLSKILPAGTRAIRFQGCSKMVLSDNAFSFAKGLWFLDLSGCCVQKLPDSIGKLEELRFLNAPGIQDQELPLSLFTGLSRLRYLSLRGSCHLLDLPEALGRLECLHHLDLSGCLGLQALPESIAKCTYLEALILSDCSGLQALPDPVMGWQTIYLEHLDLSGCSGLQVLPESILDLKILRHLDISRCSRLYILPKQFYRLTELVYLNVSCCWELRELPRSISLFPFPYLQHLDLSGCFCVRGIMEALDGLTGLQYLNISHPCGYHVEDWFHLKGLDAVLPKLTKLLFLGLSMCLDPFYYALPPVASEKFLEDCITGLDNLQHLDLSKNKFLLSLPERLGDLKALRTLDLSGCFRLQNLPERISSLIEVHLSGCLQLTSITNANASYLGEDSSHEVQREHRSLVAGAVENQGMRSTCQDTSLPTDLSAAEPEITQSTDAIGKEQTGSYKQIKLSEIDNYDPNNDPYLT